MGKMLRVHISTPAAAIKEVPERRRGMGGRVLLSCIVIREAFLRDLPGIDNNLFFAFRAPGRAMITDTKQGKGQMDQDYSGLRPDTQAWKEEKDENQSRCRA